MAYFRNLLEMTQGALAEKVGVAQQTIAKIESGARPLKFSEAASIAEVFGIYTDDLVLGTSDAASLGWVKGVKGEIDSAYEALGQAVYGVQAARVAGAAVLTRVSDFDSEPRSVQAAIVELRRAVEARVDSFVSGALTGSLHRIYAQQDPQEIDAIQTLLREIDGETRNADT